MQPPADDDAAAALAALAARSAGAIEVAEVDRRPLPRWAPPARPAPELSVSTFTRTLDEDWRRTSYSALTRAAHDAAHEQHLASEPDAPVKDDEQDTTPRAPAAPADGALPPDALPSPLSDLPGGAAFGTLVHAVLEDLDPDGAGRAVRRRGRPPARAGRDRRGPRRRAASGAGHPAGATSA